MHFKKILCSADSQKAVLVNVKNDLEQKNSKVVGGFVLNKINWRSNEKKPALRFRALIQQNTILDMDTVLILL